MPLATDLLPRLARCLAAGLLLASLLPAAPGRAQTRPAAPRDGAGAYATGRYRDLFQENGHVPQASAAKIEAAFQQLFYGDSTQAIYFRDGRNANGPLAYVSDLPHHDVRSEGMSYAMMIAVQLNKKAEFDAVWNWSVSKMYVSDPAYPSAGYFSWSLQPDGTPNSETPAPDGEEYYVMALYFAAHRWGSGPGIYNYQAWADKLLTTTRHHPLKTGPTRYGPRTVGAMVSEENCMIRFVPDAKGSEFSDPSYHLPAFYELWARWGPAAGRAFWAAAADSSRRFFARTTHPQTGLAPDYANFDGTPHATSFNPQAGTFAFDSWRTASNWSVDWAWWHKDLQEPVLSNRIQDFFAGQGLAGYGCRFTLAGAPYDARHAGGLVATNAVASLAATHEPLARDFVEELWRAPVPQAWVERYYDGLLHLMSLLHCSGQYRIWLPRR